MADKVIIVDIKRANEKIPIFELKQCAGRAGRNKYELGEVHYIVSENDIGELEEDLNRDENLYVDSVLDSNIEFHLLSEIYYGSIKREEDIFSWYERSFSYSLGIEIDFVSAIQNLVDWESIYIENKELKSTKLGEASSRLYFHPETIFQWRLNFDEIFNRGLEDNDFAISWALSNIPYSDNVGGGVYKSYQGEYIDQISSLNLNIDYGLGGGLAWWSILGGPRLSKIGNEIGARKKDYGRFNKMLLSLNEYCEWEMESFIKDLEIKVKYSIPSHLINLCKIDGIGKKSAIELYSLDIETLDDIKENINFIKSSGSDSLVRIVGKIIQCQKN